MSARHSYCLISIDLGRLLMLKNELLASVVVAMTLSITGCGGGGGGGDSSTQRSLPADPGASATVSVEGVDTNGNGVRDEVERSVSSNTPADADFNATMQVAAAYQKMVLSPEPSTREDALALFGAVACAGRDGNVFNGYEGSYLLEQTFDTPDRMAKYKAISAKIGGGFSASELPSCQ
jgi:hypothetical protein